ncbi:uncharacterized protein LOC105209676 isoform X4 [Zeugodacus cucurbitae]|uniref:uncharacterized protein LOC105209676 isoform X4 n=1 Tax=Zeugodacus cucurbitae TaxID=28588 RepID=UPI0023D8E28F|nr:uncharacterized protein LOC105209676 isoform X4 [Zeugodacus cucurbitae]
MLHYHLHIYTYIYVKYRQTVELHIFHLIKIITLIYFLLLIPWPQTHIIKLFCSKDSSRLVRKIVSSKWTPILDKYSAKLPLECPLHPLRDVFSPCQDAKKRDRPTQWTCRLCGKSFYQERFLDLHFGTRHKSVINEAEDAVCLADFCDIMRCEVFQTEESSSLTTSDQHVVTDIEVWGDSLGQNSALAKANTPYLSLIPLRTSSIGGTRAAKVQTRQLCQDKIGQNKFKDTVENVIIAEKSKKTTTIIANEPIKNMKKGHADGEHSTGSPTNVEHNKATNTQTPPHSRSQKAKKKGPKEHSHNDADEGSPSPSDNTSSPKNENGNIQKTRSSCKAEELHKLKVQCELLVRSCISGLLLTMTDQMFKEMEEEMNRAVCWYLSCDRYWEDGPLESRTFPWGLTLILIFVLSTGICFCYYIIWILFDCLFQFRGDDNQYRSTRLHVPSVPTIGFNETPTPTTAAAAAPGNDVYRYLRWHASERGPAILLPTAGPRIIPRTTSIRLSPQSKTIPDRISYAEHFNGSRHGGNTTSSARTDAESRLPTGHFRPTRLYK